MMIECRQRVCHVYLIEYSWNCCSLGMMAICCFDVAQCVVHVEVMLDLFC